MLRHRLKLLLREGYARLLWHTGLWRLVDRCMPRRMVVLYGHCVADEALNGELPPEMKISRARLQRILAALAGRFEFCTIGEGLRRLRAGRGPSLVALSFDDGYRDNAVVLPEVLAPFGAPATIFLETRALDERRLNGAHKFEVLAGRLGTIAFAERFAAACADAELASHVRAAAEPRSEDDGAGATPFARLKRVVKYERAAAVRDAALERLWGDEGLDEGARCAALYMTWEDARALAARGFELGGHTVSHPVLASLDEAEQRREVSAGKEALERALGTAVTTFAYPFGRRWDYDDASRAAVRAAGFACAVTTHAGVVVRDSEPTTLPRVPIDDTSSLPLIVAEACGAFALLRRLGVDLSE